MDFSISSNKPALLEHAYPLPVKFDAQIDHRQHLHLLQRLTVISKKYNNKTTFNPILAIDGSKVRQVHDLQVAHEM